MSVTSVLQPFYEGWATHQRRLLAAIADLGPEQLALITAPIPQRGADRYTTRGWVVWHLMEHEAHHGGVISLVLGANGLPGLDI